MTSQTRTPPQRHKAAPIWFISVASVALAFTWVLISLAFKPMAPGNYAELGTNAQAALIRGAIPMTIVGAIVLTALAVTGRLRRVWRDPVDLPPAPRWMRLLVIVPIVVTIAGLVRRVVQLPTTGPALVGALLILVLAVGFTEELIFRGWIITDLRDRGYSEFHVIWISALLFGVWHLPNVLLGQPAGIVAVQFVFTTLSGVMDYAVRRVTGRLWPAMALHAGWDFAVL